MKLLKLTGTSGRPVWVAPGKICAMERRDGTMTLIAFVGSATTTVTETPAAIAAMLAEPAELEREAWRQMEACSQAIQSAMSTVEHAAMAVRNAQ